MPLIESFNISIFFGAMWLTILMHAALTDARSRLISNYNSLLLIALFPAASLSGVLPVSWYMSVLTALAVLIVSFAMWSLKWIGGGDAKIMTAAALWVGNEDIFRFLFAVTLAGGILGLLFLFRQKILPIRSSTPAAKLSLPTGTGQPLTLKTHTGEFEKNRNPVGSSGNAPQESLPYGVAIAAGAAWIWPSLFLHSGSVI